MNARDVCGVLRIVYLLGERDVCGGVEGQSMRRGGGSKERGLRTGRESVAHDGVQWDC